MECEQNQKYYMKTDKVIILQMVAPVLIFRMTCWSGADQKFQLCLSLSKCLNSFHYIISCFRSQHCYVPRIICSLTKDMPQQKFIVSPIFTSPILINIPQHLRRKALPKSDFSIKFLSSPQIKFTMTLARRRYSL